MIERYTIQEWEARDKANRVNPADEWWAFLDWLRPKPISPVHDGGDMELIREAWRKGVEWAEAKAAEKRHCDPPVAMSANVTPGEWEAFADACEAQGAIVTRDQFDTWSSWWEFWIEAREYGRGESCLPE